MVVVGILLVAETVNHIVKYRRLKEKKDAVSAVIMGISLIFWLISLIMMIQKRAG
jgi:hypothetical protein